MEIDTGQTWRHKHNRQLVEVIDASKGTVAFRRHDSRIEWTATQFLVWYQQVKQSPKQVEPRAPRSGELWYSEDREESCVIKRNCEFVWYQYATETGERRATQSWFTNRHVLASPFAKPEYDPADVAFPERFKQSHDNAVSASQSIHRAKRAAKHAREVIEASKAATGAVIAAPEAIEELKAKAIDAMDRCHQASQELREALDSLETT